MSLWEPVPECCFADSCEIPQCPSANLFCTISVPKGHECYVAREPKENTLGGNNKGMSDWMCAVPVLSRAASPKINVMIFAIGPEGKAVNKD